MNKYSLIQNLVRRLTDDDTFRTFYTLYLMKESVEERDALGEHFWKDVDLLPQQEQRELRAEFTRSFLRLPKLLEELHERTSLEKITE
ncbi:MAG TPA: hypothetical protein VI603_06960 [Saprospiraceae bacterium]|nr:hypothetical protein [Saprospiraceae bacterium]